MWGEDLYKALQKFEQMFNHPDEVPEDVGQLIEIGWSVDTIVYRIVRGAGGRLCCHLRASCIRRESRRTNSGPLQGKSCQWSQRVQACRRKLGQVTFLIVQHRVPPQEQDGVGHRAHGRKFHWSPERRDVVGGYRFPELQPGWSDDMRSVANGAGLGVRNLCDPLHMNVLFTSHRLWYTESAT